MAKKKTSPPMETASPASDWQAHDDMHALKRAAEITADKQRHRAAKAEAKKQITHLSKVVGAPKKGARRKRLENVQL